MIYAFGFFSAFGSVFLKGFQHKNVIKNMLGHIFVTSLAMNLLDVVIVGLVVKSGFEMAIPCGFGAAFGMVSSVVVHDKLYKVK